MMEQFECFNTSFWYGETNLSMFLHHPYRMSGGFVYLCVAGEAMVCSGIDEYHIRINAESIILPGTTFSLSSFSDDFNVRLFTFSKDLYDEVSVRLGFSFSLFLRRVPYSIHKEGHYILRNSITWFDMAEIISKDTNNKFKLLMQNNFQQSYLMYLYDKISNYFQNESSELSRKQVLFHQFLSLVHEHCQTERDVAFYAERLHITSRYLWTITNESGAAKSPKEMIDKYFLLEMKVRLQSTDLSISEISYQLGFPNESYFSRYFKRHAGISLSQFRLQL